MKAKSSLLINFSVLMLLLAACGPAPTVIPTPAAIPTPTVLTITFENDECTYSGPQPIPAGSSTTVNWVVKNKDHPKYGLYVFNLNEGKTKDDLLAAANEPVPPKWAPLRGSAESGPNNSTQLTVKTDQGPLYFTCWFSDPDTMFQIIGPVEVAGTNP